MASQAYPGLDRLFYCKVISMTKKIVFAFKLNTKKFFSNVGFQS